MTWDSGFESAFNPEAVAVVGASRKTPPFSDFVRILLDAGFPGRIYPVNRNAVGEEIHGLKVYPNLSSVPEPIDLVTITVPASAIPSVLEECVATNAKNIQIYTAGFKEAGDEQGSVLEEKLKHIAASGGLRILGPNCMGIHVPNSKLTTWVNYDPEPGPVAMLAQSGGHAGQFVFDAPLYGLHLSKVISYGNAAVLDCIDFLEYLATDAESEIICMYLEGVSDGGRLTTLVREINITKPVIIWKGGTTESGVKAAASHTGSLGGQIVAWDAFFKQTGAVRADSSDELLDLAMTFRYLRPMSGNRVALVGGGGGNSVAGADVCSKAELDLPTFTEATLQELKGFIPREGAILRNPIDLATVMADFNTLMRAIKSAISDPLIDAVILSLSPGLFFFKAAMGSKSGMSDIQEAMDRESEIMLDTLIEFDHSNANKKPLIIVFVENLARFLPGQEERCRHKLLKEGIPVYYSLERASHAIGKFVHYHEFQKAVDVSQ
jgi:acyl-CoA synthetase (NDP forming)